MRLRRLRLQDYRALQNIDIGFPAAEATPAALGSLPVYLLVGVNGTGKTGILRALAHIFSFLEYRQAPSIPFAVEYEVDRGDGHYAVSITGDGSDALSGVQFEVKAKDKDAEQLDPADWASYLPALTVVYTSGSLREWYPILAGADDERERRNQDRSELLRRYQTEGRNLQEIAGIPDLLEPIGVERVMSEITPSRTRLFSSAHLELALLATLAANNAEDERLFTEPKPRQSIYLRAGIDRLQGFALHLRPLVDQDMRNILIPQVDMIVRSLLGSRLEEDDELRRRLQELTSHPMPVLPEQQAMRVRQLAAFAVHRHRNPDGSYHLRFEMNSDTRLALSGSQGLFATPVVFFDFLMDLQDRGVLAQVDLILQKTDLKEPILSRHLSDGEFEFLGRMALLFLLRQPETLFLLDEPETHFNDLWKREVVELLSATLQGRNSNVLLSTHSSIVVSDVPHSQVILLTKNEKGDVRVVDIHSPTFGADPSEVLMELLNAPDSTGSYAAGSLDKLLERDWQPNEKEQLEQIIRSIGAGYYRSELRTIWRRLNAVQH